jgi:hypothetical protein
LPPAVGKVDVHTSIIELLQAAGERLGQRSKDQYELDTLNKIPVTFILGLCGSGKSYLASQMMWVKAEPHLSPKPGRILRL